MAEGNGEIAVRDPDALIKEIERTREDLARTIDELTQRVSPANVARNTVGKLREQTSRPQVRLAGGIALVAVVGLAYLARRRRR